MAGPPLNLGGSRVSYAGRSKTVGETKGGTRLHCSEDILVKSSLGSITNEEHDQVTLLNNIKHLSKSVRIFRETNLTSLFERGRSLTKTNTNLDVASCLIKRITKILCLGGSLGSPSNHTNFLNSLEGFGKKREKITSSLDNLFLGISKINFSDFENI